MRKELFEAIKAKIESTLPEILHVDLWNHNVEYIEEETPWARPAVFVEFGAISWQPLQGGGRRGSGVVRLHLVTDWAEGEYATAFALSRKLLRAVEGLEGEEYHGMALMETATNHNHEDILESVDTYAVRYTMAEP
jgi:hypothetical protein